MLSVGGYMLSDELWALQALPGEKCRHFRYRDISLIPVDKGVRIIEVALYTHVATMSTSIHVHKNFVVGQSMNVATNINIQNS